MVFLPGIGEYYDKLLPCGKYHPYRIWGQDGSKVKNPNFDSYSGLILDLKDGKPQAIEHFRNFLDQYLAADIAIAVIPSSDPLKVENGVRSVAKALAANNRIDASGCLVRTAQIAKLAHGGDRDVSVHLNSLKVENPHLVKGRAVLLLDDVTTSGNSLKAGKQLLERVGAAKVQMVAFAETVKESL